MTAHEDEAICVRRQDYSETSQLLTMFGRTHGKINCIAKGSRRATGKFGGGVDLLSRGYMQFRLGQGDSNLAALTEFQLQESYSALRQNLVILNCGLLAGDLVSRVTIDGDPHEAVYETLRQFLSILGSDERTLLLMVRFELALLREIGLIPNWFQCAGCMQPIEAQSGAAFSFVKSGVLCRSCKLHFPQKQSMNLEVLRFLQNPKRQPDIAEEILWKTHQFLAAYYCHLIGRETKMIKFVTELLRQHCRRKALKT